MRDKTVLDPHQHEKHYEQWKDEGMKIDNISPKNRDIVLKYLDDMAIGINVSPVSKKGARGFGRLRNLKGKMTTFIKIYEASSGKDDITLANEEDVLKLMKDMREGKYKASKSGKKFQAVGTYGKVFKAFWNWYIRHSKKEGKTIENICVDMDTKDAKPKFHYFTIDQLKIMCDNAKMDYKTLMMFLFDTGCRAPTELLNIEVSDISYNAKDECFVNIREETSKTFGRKIKLLLCVEVLKEYIKQYKLKGNDKLFNKTAQNINKFLRENGNKYLNIGKKVAKSTDNRWINEGITMYDFRHSSACYWLPRYKSESALKYRFGWKKSDMIHYYTEFLGMKDTIQEEDLYIDITKTDLEKELALEKKRREMLEENMQSQLKDQETRLSEEMEKKMKAIIKDMLEGGQLNHLKSN